MRENTKQPGLRNLSRGNAALAIEGQQTIKPRPNLGRSLNGESLEFILIRCVINILDRLNYTS